MLLIFKLFIDSGGEVMIGHSWKVQAVIIVSNMAKSENKLAMRAHFVAEMCVSNVIGYYIYSKQKQIIVHNVCISILPMIKSNTLHYLYIG